MIQYLYGTESWNASFMCLCVRVSVISFKVKYELIFFSPQFPEIKEIKVFYSLTILDKGIYYSFLFYAKVNCIIFSKLKNWQPKQPFFPGRCWEWAPPNLGRTQWRPLLARDWWAPNPWSTTSTHCWSG